MPLETSEIYGFHPVKAALVNLDESQSRQYQQSILYIERHKSTQKYQPIVKLAKQKQIRFQLSSTKEMDKLCSNRHQGLYFQYRSSQEPLTELKNEQYLENLLEKHLENVSNNKLLLLVLDSIKDPHNLGACLRTANGLGVNAVIIPKDNSVGLTPVVRKVACGAEQKTPIIQVTNLVRTLKYLKKSGVWLTGLAGEAEYPISEIDFNNHSAIIMGAEEKGLRRLTRDNCDYLARIPMFGTVESYNVSVACAMTLYEVIRQRS
ncbi:MAG: 23S rRNA (guanosine(2251)-2'-O)-methyltransferase RlmB [Gammaproteobacteria bacterium]|nr:23S rRNA (guanosine(2251)-2'-O)-methyltransferase RlmB [Gammaproteobacteria bacterium]